MDLRDYTALEAGKMVRERQIGCEELTRHALRAIAETEPALNACVTVLEEEALASARAVQARLDAGETLSPLAGVPMVIKDNICTAGIPTTCGSKMLETFRPPYNATVYARLLAAGAVLVAKTNLDEFAMGGSNETSHFGPVHNPWDTTRVPGGSSGGSAASVAAGQAFYALGSDTGGSIRQPCAFCGVSGVKPTYGAVSRYGLIAYASSLDQIGTIGRDIRDCAAALRLIEGRDERDSTSVARPPEPEAPAGVRGLKIGIPANYFGKGIDPAVAAPVQAAARTFEEMGAALVDIELPLAEYAIPAYYVVACAEASSNLSRYDGVKYGFAGAGAESLEELYLRTRSEGFGIEVKRRIMLGAFVLSAGYFDAYYKKAMQARELIQRDFDRVFTRCDVILSPNAPTTAYKIGENISDPLKMYLGDVYTVSVNLAGLPGVTVPCGFADGLPVGLQLIGRAFDEATLFRAAAAFQSETDFHRQRPNRPGEEARA
ncbi:MAG: Asp-tRNA(Asn)/Glu-tRNA(Gln) amidotransferase subunit GatA [Oscillospiraceae bacterium]|jgi:aspartyl-tRNA(Asn)/glutamyl-tRNA(Gln) amidotransferase subunit A|nr:Asp-tRNA(Asn)/Glu-tRNA(Gln) amidotransferase subunit GatA [Oscillospiraceae bacterium]